MNTLFQDSRGQIWAGTYSAGISIYIPELDLFRRVSRDDVPDVRIWDFVEDDKGRIWVGTATGLYCYEPTAAIWTYTKVPRLDWDEESIVRAILISQSDNSKMWLGTRNGLFLFDLSSGEFEHCPQPPAFSDRPGQDRMIMDICHVDEHQLLMTSWGAGLLQYNIRDGSWTNCLWVDPATADEDDWINIAWNVAPAHANEFWVTTSQGFGLFNNTINTIRFYDSRPKNSSSIKESFYYCGFTTLRSESVAVGGFGGLNIGTIISPSATDHRAVITTITFDNILAPLDTSYTFVRQLNMSEEFNDLAMNFATPGIEETSISHYRYRLNGYDKDRQVTGSDGLVRYTNLDRGTYEFEFDAVLIDGTTIDGKHKLIIHRTGPYWTSVWFIVAVAGVLVSVITAFYWINVRSIKQREILRREYDKKLANVEMSALRAQMNPHFMFNSLNSIKTYILKERTKEASLYLTKFSQLMRAVLNNSKNALVPLAHELNALKLYIELEALRFEDEFQYHINVAPDIDTEQVLFPPLLIQPYVENAIRHGLLEKQEGERSLIISMELNDHENLVVTIDDNGIGRNAHAERKSPIDKGKISYGMDITRDRIALIQQTLGFTAHVTIIDKYEHNIPTGTSVQITIPLMKTNSVDLESPVS